MKEQLTALYSLQLQDSALDAMKRQFAALDSGREEKTAYEAADEAYKTAHTEQQTVSADLKDAELEQKAIETKRSDIEKKLYGGTVRNPKELQAMQEEIEMLDRQRARLDDKILTLMETLEIRRKEEAETKQLRSAALSAFKQKQEAYKQTAESIRSQAQELVAQRNAAEKSIPEALLKRYNTLRAARGGIAIAAVEDGNACGGCKMALPSTLITRIHEGNTIEICGNCARMLCEAPK